MTDPTDTLARLRAWNGGLMAQSDLEHLAAWMELCNRRTSRWRVPMSSCASVKTAAAADGTGIQTTEERRRVAESGSRAASVEHCSHFCGTSPSTEARPTRMRRDREGRSGGGHHRDGPLPVPPAAGSAARDLERAHRCQQS